jgi:hypothetical protein
MLSMTGAALTRRSVCNDFRDMATGPSDSFRFAEKANAQALDSFVGTFLRQELHISTIWKAAHLNELSAGAAIVSLFNVREGKVQ